MVLLKLLKVKSVEIPKADEAINANEKSIWDG
jgi:hypothetical protein